jgi:hypothetical protein
MGSEQRRCGCCFWVREQEIAEASRGKGMAATTIAELRKRVGPAAQLHEVGVLYKLA